MLFPPSRRFGADRIMSKNTVFKRIGVSVLLAAAIFLLPVLNAFGGLNAYAASEYYEANKDTVEVIDGGAAYFALLDDEGDEANMQAMVTVATAINDFIGGYNAIDYTSSDWADITRQFNLCKNYFKVSADPSDTLNYYMSYANFLEDDKYQTRIDGYKAIVDAYSTKQETFEEYRQESADYLANKKANLIDGGPLGMYDTQAVSELDVLVEQGQAAVNAVEPVTNDGAIDLVQSRKAADDKKAEYVDKLESVPKNDIERAENAVSDYRAIASGDKDGDKDAAKAAALEAIEKANTFYNGAPNGVKEYYAQNKEALDAFTVETEPEDLSDLEESSTIDSGDGVVTIKAYADGVEVKVFPAGASVKIDDNSGSIYSINMDTAIAKFDSKISVAYCIEISIYEGSSLWEQKTQYEGKDITYTVSVDLAKYFTNCVESKSSWFADWLDGIGIKKKAGENKLDGIKECVQYLSGNNSEGSLCYHYSGKGVVEALNYRVEGDTIIFETKSFSNFAVTKAGGRSVLINPVFWLIFLLAIIIAFVVFVVVIKLLKYTITFDSNGGSDVAPVKAKKDEYFVLPANPTKRGYTFAGWYEDKALSVRFVDTCLVKRRSFTVYAKWNEGLTTEQANEYFVKLREALASKAKIGESYEIEKDACIRLAKLVNDGVEVKLYLALDPEAVLSEGTYNIKAVAGDEFTETPLLKIVDSMEAYDEAVALIGLPVCQYDLKATEPVIEDLEATEYVLELGEGGIEAADAEEAVEEPVEEAEEEAASEEELKNYYNEIRSYVKGFALAEEPEGLDRNATFIRVFLKEETVDVYLKLDPETEGVEKAEGILAIETPALVKVCCDETLESAKAIIKTMMDEYGLEETGEEADLGDSEAKSFAYKLKFEE